MLHMESSTILYSCSYCKGHGHFKSQCLKRITKNLTDNICRDYNRYKHAPCEFSDDERSCLHARSHCHALQTGFSKGLLTEPQKTLKKNPCIHFNDILPNCAKHLTYTSILSKIIIPPHRPTKAESTSLEERQR